MIRWELTGACPHSRFYKYESRSGRYYVKSVFEDSTCIQRYPNFRYFMRWSLGLNDGHKRRETWRK